MKKIIVIGGLTLIVLGTASVSLLNLSVKKNNDQTQKLADSSPVVEPSVVPPEPPKVISRDRKKITAKIKKYTKSVGGSWGIYVYETDTGVSYGQNQKNVFIAASTNKVPIMAKVYDRIEAGKLKKSQLITKTYGDQESGTGVLQGKPAGSKFKVSYLMYVMLHYSDNVATNMLIRTVGRSNVALMVKKMKLKIDMYNNTTTPEAMGKLLAKLYAGKLTTDSNKKEILKQMYKTAFESRLPRLFGKNDAKIYHKIGTRGGTVSDVGIVGLKGRPYIICVYVSGIAESKAEAAIGKISKTIYNYEKTL